MGEQPHDEDVPGNVILTGFMGTGKSTIGRLLAARLGREWVDTDALIESRRGPIAEIFAQQGEAAFRAYERQAAEELARRRGLVISTGGRLMLDDRNASLLGETGRVFCLAAAPEVIVARLSQGNGGVRPLVGGPDWAARVVELLRERQEGYRRFAQVVTDGRSVEQIVDELAAMLEAADRR